MKFTTIIGTAIAAVGLAACGSGSTTPAASPTPSPTATPVPTPSPTPTPLPPLVATAQKTGSSVQLTLIAEDGTVAATVAVPVGIDGNDYYVGTSHVYFVSGTEVKALARDGSISVAGQIPQLSSTVTAATRQGYTTFAVSPDESTLVFGIPLAVAGDNGATADHSQLWTEPVRGTAASGTLVYNDANDTTNGGQVLLPFAWTSAGISVSQQPMGLGGAGPFGSFAEFQATTFDLATRTLENSLQCTATNPSGSVCVIQASPASSSSSLKIVQSSGTTTLAMQPANAEYGAVTVSNDGRYLAYGSYVGSFGEGYYQTHVVDLSTNTAVATVRNYAPAFWLPDGRLIVGQGQYQPGTWLLSPTFTSPLKISSSLPVGALGVLPPA